MLSRAARVMLSVSPVAISSVDVEGLYPPSPPEGGTPPNVAALLGGENHPVIDCDIDHTRTWADTGVTDSEDLAPLCRHDHCIRHQTGWTYQRLPDGDYLWTSPLGGPGYTTSGNDPP